MTDSEQRKIWYGQDLKHKKNWYGEVAAAYNKVRPRYPQKLIDRVVELAQLPADASILELGCGPGNATTAFAQLGFSMVCLEPSQEAYQLARQNCATYPNVKIYNTTFEEWELETDKFHAVLAATSFHWISPEIGYAKAAAALQNQGSLILLWNMTPQPSYAVYQMLQAVYASLAPSLGGYEEQETQEQIVAKFGQAVIDSGQFHGLVTEYLPCKVMYSMDDYLLLLSTLSPYIALEPQKQVSLFKALTEVLQSNGYQNIEVSYLSAFNVAQLK